MRRSQQGCAAPAMGMHQKRPSSHKRFLQGGVWGGMQCPPQQGAGTGVPARPPGVSRAQRHLALVDHYRQVGHIHARP
jgi:hypothetical protein